MKSLLLLLTIVLSQPYAPCGYIIMQEVETSKYFWVIEDSCEQSYRSFSTINQAIADAYLHKQYVYRNLRDCIEVVKSYNCKRVGR